MRQPAEPVRDDDVLRLLRDEWSLGVDRVEQRPARAGSHRWCARQGPRPLLLVTWHRLGGGSRHTADSLEAAHAAAVELAFAFDAVVAPLVTDALTCTVALDEGALSVTPWVHGTEDRAAEPADQVRLLERLHGVRRPRPLRDWTTQVPPDLTDRLDALLADARDPDPRAREACQLLEEHLPLLSRWTAEHTDLLPEIDGRPRVVTHGDPGEHHQLQAPGRLLLVGWESVSAAPRERDLLAVVRGGHGHLVDADPALLRLFDLDRRLDGVARCASHLAGQHRGGAEGRAALQGLREAVTGPVPG